MPIVLFYFLRIDVKFFPYFANYYITVVQDLLAYAEKMVTGVYKMHRKIAIDNSFIVQDLGDTAKRTNRFQVLNYCK